MDEKQIQLKKYEAQYRNHPERKRIMKEVNRDLFRDDIVQPGTGRFASLYPEQNKEREKERERFEYFEKEKKKKKEEEFKSRRFKQGKSVTLKGKLLKDLAKDHPKVFNEEDY